MAGASFTDAFDQLPLIHLRRVKINCSDYEFYEFFKNFENYGKWFPGIIYMRSADNLPHGTVGKRYDELAQAPFGKEEEITVQVVDATPNRHLAIEASLEPFLPRFDYTIHRINDGSIEFEWACRTRGKGIKALLARPIFRKILASRLDKAMHQLKALLENDKNFLMQAAQIRRYGDAATVNIINEQAFRPVVKPDEILVRNFAASINHIDIQRRKGYGAKIFTMRGAGNWPVILGNDFAGEIVQAGNATKGFKAGDRVFGAKPPSSEGSFAQYVAVKVDQVAHLPASLSMQNAAALPYTFITAWAALVTESRLTSRNARHKRVLIQGGAGGVGAMAAQLAKAWGAHVEVTCHHDDIQWILSRGIDAAHDFAQPGVLTTLKDFDIALCAANPAQQDELINTLKKNAGAVYVTLIHPALSKTDKLGILKGVIQSKKMLKALNKELQHSGRRAAWVLYKPNHEALQNLANLAVDGAIVQRVDSVFALRDITAAQQRLEQGLARGKVIVEISH
jgi:reticulon-4-interacting protein 1, mitochondrial